VPLNVEGKIAWQRKVGDSFQCGIEFGALDATQTALMKQCFEFYNKNPEFSAVR